MMMPVAQYVISLGSDGRIASHGSVAETLAVDKEMQKEVMESEIAEQKADEAFALEGAEENKLDNSGKLVMAEEVVEGHIGWDASEWHSL